MLEEVSRSGMTNRSVWSAYAARALAEVGSCSLTDLCAIVRAFSRVRVAKRSLLNSACKRLRREARNLTPRLMAQVVSDLRRLGHLDGPMLVALAGGMESRWSEFEAFDLPLLLCGFARASVRDEKRIAQVGQLLQERRRELEPSSAVMAVYALAMLDSDGGGAVHSLASVAGRRLMEMSRSELVNLVFALVMSDVASAELLSFALERLARQRHELEPREVHALRIVEHCVRLPEALQPSMQTNLTSDPLAAARCREAVTQIEEGTGHVAVSCPVTSSKLQKMLERFFRRLELPHRAEGAVGPYMLDYVLPQRIAVEVDGFKHYYAFSRRLTAKSQLKLRVLRAMNWRVVSLPHFEWLPRKEDERLAYLAAQIEQATCEPLARLRRSVAEAKDVSIGTTDDVGRADGGLVHNGSQASAGDAFDFAGHRKKTKFPLGSASAPNRGFHGARR